MLADSQLPAQERLARADQQAQSRSGSNGTQPQTEPLAQAQPQPVSHSDNVPFPIW